MFTKKPKGNGQPQGPDGRWVSRPPKKPKKMASPPAITAVAREKTARAKANPPAAGDTFKAALGRLGMPYEEFARLTGEARIKGEDWCRLDNAPPIAWTVLWMMETVPALRMLLESRYEVEE